jgi:hypothetical protein
LHSSSVMAKLDPTLLPVNPSTVCPPSALAAQVT